MVSRELMEMFAVTWYMHSFVREFFSYKQQIGAYINALNSSASKDALFWYVKMFHLSSTGFLHF